MIFRCLQFFSTRLKTLYTRRTGVDDVNTSIFKSIDKLLNETYIDHTVQIKYANFIWMPLLKQHVNVSLDDIKSIGLIQENQNNYSHFNPDNCQSLYFNNKILHNGKDISLLSAYIEIMSILNEAYEHPIALEVKPKVIYSGKVKKNNNKESKIRNKELINKIFIQSERISQPHLFPPQLTLYTTPSDIVNIKSDISLKSEMQSINVDTDE